MMRFIEAMKGTGAMTSNAGERVPVQYELHVYQEQIPAGTMQSPHATVPRMKEIRGTVLPVRFFGESGLLLEMQDGRKLKFFLGTRTGTSR